ncbi:hypothetical protein [Aureispira sp. CCB-QB1]|uniref:hypothetical protein n=1 Tax=Aureispira sp. CCB-QB1 TaxID=1313421 RepID=UPI000699157A|nr:hypothetical protein [Aureispira sp. CCB-QB1]
MKAKLGTFRAIKNTKYGSYQSLFKKKVMEVLKDPKANATCDYVLVSGEHLSWNGASTNEEQPLLFLGQKTSWEKEVKANKTMDLKAYSYGTCKLVKVGSDLQIVLCPEKGKLTQDTLLKPLKKVFKSFKPKAYLEVVADLNEVESSTVVDFDQGDESGLNLLKSIGTDLQKYHLTIEKIKKAIVVATTEEEKMSLLVKQNQVLKRLKHLCASWATDIMPQAEQLIIEKQGETWQKIYQKWSTFFEKRKAAKAGDSSNQDAVKAQEENIYTKAVKDLEQFYDNLKKANSISSSVVEANIENLENHLDTWRNFVKGGKIHFPEKLQRLEGTLLGIKKDWAKLKPLIKEQNAKQEELNKALEGDDYELIMDIYRDLESINLKISNL